LALNFTGSSHWAQLTELPASTDRTTARLVQRLGLRVAPRPVAALLAEVLGPVADLGAMQ